MIEKTKNRAQLLNLGLMFFVLIGSAFSHVLAQKALPHLVTGSAFLDKAPAISGYDIAIDSNNLAYIASSLGIQSFNGTALRKLPIKGDLKKVAFDTFYEDARNRFWCRSLLSGLYIVTKDGVIPYKYSHLIAKYDGQKIDDCYQDANGTLHFAPRGAGYITISKDGVLDHKVDHSAGAFGYVHFMLEDGRPFVFSLLGPPKKQQPKKMAVFHWDGADSFKKITDLESNHPIFKTGFVKHENGVMRLSFGTEELVTFMGDSLISVQVLPHKIIDLFVDRDQDLWIGTVDHGVSRFQNGDFSSDEHFLGDAPAAIVAQDQDGGLWAQCSEVFFYYIPFLDRKSFGQSTPDLDALVFGAIVSDGKRVFLKSESRYLTVLSGDSISRIPIPGAGASIPGLPKAYTYPKCIYYDSARDWVWLGMLGRVLAFDGEVWHEYEVPRLAVTTSLIVRDIAQMNDGSIIASTKGGLLRIQDDGVHFYEQTKNKRALKIRQVLFDSSGTGWLGAHNGVWQFQDGAYTQFSPESSFSDSLNGLILELQEGLGRIWIQPLNGSLHYVEGSEVKQVKTNQGDRVSLHELVIGPDGNIWGRSQRPGFSLIRISLENGEITVKEYDNRLAYEDEDYSFLGGLSFTDRDMLYVSGRTIYSTPLEYLDFGHHQPRILMDRIFVNHQPVFLKSDYDLLPDENTVQLSFESIYYGMDDILFRHRLAGLDSNWQVSEHPTAQYTNLGPGDYQFQLEVKSATSEWEKGSMVNFHVQTPYWQTWWFITLSVLAGIALVGLGFYLWFRIRERRAQLIIEKLMAEQRTLRSQMNPHFLFNALMSLQDMVFKRNRMDAVTNISSFATLTRKILAQSIEDVITLEEEIEMLTLYLELESLRFDDRFRFDIAVEAGIDPATRLLPPMLIQPFVENAIKHGLQNKELGGGEILIAFSSKGNGLLCAVEDNGVGRAQAAAMRASRTHKSFSLAAIQERIALLNHQMEQKIELNIIDRDKLGFAGTRVELYLPLNLKLKH